MLTYSNTRILFYSIMLILLSLSVLTVISYWWLVIALAIYLLIVFYGSAFINSGFHIKAICSGNTKQKEIALTFDDGPCKNVTPEILNVLNEFNVKATFFCIGKNVKQNPSIVKRIVNEGHIVANHSYNHSWAFNLSSSKNMLNELEQTNKEIFALTGKNLKYFRPPYGVTNPNLAKAINKLGFKTIGWSLRSMDTVIKKPKKLFNRIIKKIKPGDIILLHDSQPGTILALKQLLAYCKKNNFVVTPLNKMINETPYE